MSTNDHNGNHLPDDNNPTPADAATGHAKSWMAKVFRQAIWLVPFLAVINFAQSLIKLGVASEGWQQTVDTASRKVLHFELEPWTGIATSFAMMTYWVIRDGWRRLFRRPIMGTIRQWWRKTTAEWRAEELAEERAKGEASGDAKGYARAMAAMERNTGSSPDGDHPPQSDNRTP